ncbi:hypothetical protein TIFTF001_033868 [Ficus carica]|uniref:Uncharacterized protein n=1 Tax=Ficus carica TaxID=3494 RepID=A0AA88DYX8_FICCA|nr:hypothetical protein TIFTF001_033868 [Ficus carica]
MENGEEHRRKIATKNGVKSPENHEEIAATGASVEVRLRQGMARPLGIATMGSQRQTNHELSLRDIVGGGARSRPSVVVAVSKGPPASSRWFLRRSPSSPVKLFLSSPKKLVLGWGGFRVFNKFRDYY